MALSLSRFDAFYLFSGTKLLSFAAKAVAACCKRAPFCSRFIRRSFTKQGVIFIAHKVAQFHGKINMHLVEILLVTNAMQCVVQICNKFTFY
jgi:hypothetical protein